MSLDGSIEFLREAAPDILRSEGRRSDGRREVSGECILSRSCYLMSRIPDEIQLYRIRESWGRDCCGDDDGGAKGNVVVVDRDAGLGG